MDPGVGLTRGVVEIPVVIECDDALINWTLKTITPPGPCGESEGEQVQNEACYLARQKSSCNGPLLLDAKAAACLSHFGRLPISLDRRPRATRASYDRERCPAFGTSLFASSNNLSAFGGRATWASNPSISSLQITAISCFPAVSRFAVTSSRDRRCNNYSL